MPRPFWSGAVLIGIGLIAGFLLARRGPVREAPEPGKASAPAVSHTWKLGSMFPGTLPIRGEDAVRFADEVTRATQGRVTIKFFDPGKLVPALEVFDAVSKGSVDAGWSSAGNWVGKIPAAALFTAVPFGPDVGEYLGWLFEGGGLEIWRELYARQNLHVEPCSLIPPEASGWFREEIRDVKQFQGKKLRYYGLGGKVIQKLGASVQLLAAGDIYPALERGVLDGLEFSVPVMDQRMGFSRVAKHYYFPGWHQPTSFGELIVNLERWNEISPDDQLIIGMACRASMIHNLAKGEAMESPVMAQFEQEGVSLHYWDRAILEEFKRRTDEVMAEESAKDADFARAWESLRSYRARNADWSRLSRLPPDFGR
jgi:TRAP-type mannitol/chloroaromatic compound transport system substrate-binding protein